MSAELLQSTITFYRMLKGGCFKQGGSQGSLGSFREPKGALGRIGDYWVIYPFSFMS